MPKLHATPYDTSAVGFYFDDFDEYEKKADKAENEYGDPVEEFEIQFIDGDDTELKLFNAMGVAQHNLEEYFDAVDSFDEDDLVRLTILMQDMGYDFDTAMDKKEDLVVYGEFKSDKDFAYEYIDGFGSLEDALGDNVQNYFDYDAFGRDLRLGGDLYDEDDPDAESRYDDMSDQEIGEEFADSLGWEGIGKQNLENYFDWDAFARDLMFDMSEMDGVYYDPQSV